MPVIFPGTTPPDVEIELRGTVFIFDYPKPAEVEQMRSACHEEIPPTEKGGEPSFKFNGCKFHQCMVNKYGKGWRGDSMIGPTGNPLEFSKDLLKQWTEIADLRDLADLGNKLSGPSQALKVQAATLGKASAGGDAPA